MREEESTLGLIKIHREVLAQIAFETVREIEGVSRMVSSFKNTVTQLFTKGNTPGIEVSIDKNNKIKLNIYVIVEYDTNIPEIANKIQGNVKIALEKMTNLSLIDINVSVQGVERRKQ